MAPSVTRRERSRRSPCTKRPARMLARSRVPAAVRMMAAPSGTARFNAARALAVTAEKDPGRVYPHFEALAALLGGDSKIMRWGAMQILARLAPVDRDGKWDSVLDTYLAFIRGDDLVSAANAIGGAGKLARVRPDLLDRIIPAILDVEGARYRTRECRNVAIGQALDVLQELWPSVRGRPDVAAFVRRQRGNPRAAVARRALRMTTDLP